MSVNKSNNAVTCFMWYITNDWNLREAKRLFGEELGKHIFDKWLYYRTNHLTEIQWYGELDVNCRNKIVEAACTLYGESTLLIQ